MGLAGCKRQIQYWNDYRSDPAVGVAAVRDVCCLQRTQSNRVAACPFVSINHPSLNIPPGGTAAGHFKFVSLQESSIRCRQMFPYFSTGKLLYTTSEISSLSGARRFRCFFFFCLLTSWKRQLRTDLFQDTLFAKAFDCPFSSIRIHFVLYVNICSFQLIPYVIFYILRNV